MVKKKKKQEKPSETSSKWMFWVIGISSACVLGLSFLGNFSSKEAPAEGEFR